MILSPVNNDLATFNAKLAQLGESSRYWRINALEAWYSGHQYVGRPSWWDATVPLRDRAPVVQSQFARVAINRLATLVFGDRSFPSIKVGARAYRVALTDDERAKVQALVDEIAESIALSHIMRQYIVEGLKCSSACAIVSLYEGRPRVEIVPSKRCTPTLRPDGTVAALVIEYKHPSPDNSKLWLWYRREITEKADTVFDPVPVIDGQPPRWGASRSIAGEFCPVVWTRNLRSVVAGDDIDGTALIEGLEDEIEALDRELSQLDRNSLYNGEPQTVVMGVDAAPLGAAGETAGASGGGLGFSWLNTVLPRGFLRGGSSTGAAATQKAPGKRWDLPAGGDAKLLESTGSGAQILTTAIGSMRRVLTDATGVVLVDPQTLGNGDLSARALTLMHAPMLDVADNLRVEYGAALRSIVDAFLRLCSGAAARRDGVLLASYDDAAPVLAKFYADAIGRGRQWVGAAITLAWGPYFEPSAADRQTAVDTARKACSDRPVLSHRAAVAAVARLYGVEDVDAEVEAIDREANEARSAVSSTLARLADAEAPEVTIDDAPLATGVSGGR